MGSLWESPKGVLGPVKDECLAGPASSVAKAPSVASLGVIQVSTRAAQRCWASCEVDALALKTSWTDISSARSMESEAESTKLVSAGVVNDVAAEDHEPGHVPP